MIFSEDLASLIRPPSIFLEERLSLRAVPPFNLYIPMRQQGEPYSSLVKSPMTTTLLETEGLTALLAARASPVLLT